MKVAKKIKLFLLIFFAFCESNYIFAYLQPHYSFVPDDPRVSIIRNHNATLKRNNIHPTLLTLTIDINAADTDTYYHTTIDGVTHMVIKGEAASIIIFKAYKCVDLMSNPTPIIGASILVSLFCGTVIDCDGLTLHDSNHGVSPRGLPLLS